MLILAPDASLYPAQESSEVKKAQSSAYDFEPQAELNGIETYALFRLGVIPSKLHALRV